MPKSHLIARDFRVLRSSMLSVIFFTVSHLLTSLRKTPTKMLLLGVFRLRLFMGSTANAMDVMLLLKTCGHKHARCMPGNYRSPIRFRLIIHRPRSQLSPPTQDTPYYPDNIGIKVPKQGKVSKLIGERECVNELRLIFAVW